MIKYWVEIFFNLPLFFFKNTLEPKIVLILTPQYLNFGDHAIALAEKKLLKKKFADLKFVEINLSFYQFWEKRVRKIIGKDDFIIITGGGFVGDLWEDSQMLVNHIIKTFKQNQIMFAPQTICFNSSNKEKFFKKLLKKHGKVYVLAREDYTYQLLIDKMHFVQGKNCDIVPDMALFLKVKITDKNRKKAVLCFRTDHEKIMPESDINAIKLILSKQNMPFVKMKMAYRHVEIPTWLRQWFVNRKLKQYMGKKVVITDRLHSMIFAAITATPCIVFDNISRKISGVYETWMKELSYIKVINNVQDFEKALQEVTAKMDRKKILELWQKELEAKNIELIWKELEKWYGKNT